MDPAPTRYIDRDGAMLAYQVVGDGPVDVVYFFEIAMHLDLSWTDPDIHHVFERAASYARTTYFQLRGVGLSDQISYTPTIEQQADDVLAVMDAVGMQRATLVGLLGTCGALALVAARAPERVHALVFINPVAEGAGTAEPHGWTTEEAESFRVGYRQAFEHWGAGGTLGMWDPVQVTPYNLRQMGLMERCSASPASARGYYDWVMQIDIRDVLRSARVPARVLRLPTSPVPEAAARYVAELLPDAEFHELPPTARGASIGQAWLPISDHIEEVATGSRHSADADRFLGTVLFTDVVSSTELLASVGDARYREMRSAHERLVRLQVESVGGRVMTVAGDGTFSVFDGPTKAVRCAETICTEAAQEGIAVRCGVHTGELERDGSNVTGMTVHIGARVGAAAGPGEVLVSRTVRDLVVGSGLAFESRGDHELRGVPGPWELFSVSHAGEQQGSIAVEGSLKTPIDKVALESARRAPRLTRAAVRMANALERRRRASSPR